MTPIHFADPCVLLFPKWSQQDMLPVILGNVTGMAGGHGGYVYGGGVSPTGFDDTWRMIGGIAKAIAGKNQEKKPVDVHIMVSAPCAFASNDPCTLQGFAMKQCPWNGEKGSGHDYWQMAYTRYVFSSWLIYRNVMHSFLQAYFCQMS